MDRIKAIFAKNISKFVYLFIISINILVFYYFYAFVNDNIIEPITISNNDIVAKIRENKEEIDTKKLEAITSDYDKKTAIKEKYIRNMFQN